MWFTEDTDIIFEHKLQKERTGHFVKKRFEKHKAPTEGTRAANQNTRVAH